MAGSKATKVQNACPVCHKPRGAGTNHGKCVEILAASEPKRKKIKPERVTKSLMDGVEFFDKLTEYNEW